MFSLFRRGPLRPQDAFDVPVDGPIRYDHARFRAWALALGHERPSVLPPRPARPHRGQLPDVDFAAARPVVRRRFLFGLLATMLGLRQHAPPDRGSVLSDAAGTADSGLLAGAGETVVTLPSSGRQANRTPEGRRAA